MSENTAPTLAELNAHLFASMLPETHGIGETAPKAKRRAKDQAGDEPQAATATQDTE